MVIPGQKIADDTETASIGNIGESSDILSSDILSPGTSDILRSPAHTRSYGKAKKTKDREPFYKGYRVVYLPGDINGRNCIY